MSFAQAARHSPAASSWGGFLLFNLRACCIAPSRPLSRKKPKKGGNGYLSSFSVNIGVAEARACGMLGPDGQPAALEKIIDPESKSVIIRVKTDD